MNDENGETNGAIDLSDVRKLAKGERFNLGLATGNTMITLYDELADKFNRARADLSLLSTWNLDEYSLDGKGAVPHDHPLSYWKYMHEMPLQTLSTVFSFIAFQIEGVCLTVCHCESYDAS